MRNIKRCIYFFLICIVVCTGFLTTKVHAAEIVLQGECGEQLTWSLDSEGTFTISGQGPMKVYDFDWESERIPLVPWVDYRNQIKKIIIEDGVTSVSYYSFYECVNLKEIVIGKDVETIERGVFLNCSNTEKISIGAGLKYVDDLAFAGLHNMKEIHIADIAGWCGIEWGSQTRPIGTLYVDGVELTNLVIPQGVTKISDGAFSGRGLVSVQIPDSVVSIGKNAFEGCFFTEVTIPDSVTSMDGAFYNCDELLSITIPASIKSLGHNTFAGCDKLAEVNLPEGLQELGGAFYGCKSLKSITIPESVTSMEATLGECTGLTDIQIPENVSSIGRDTFSGCTGLTKVRIPGKVISIGDRVFENCTNLTEIALPDSLESIGDHAFKNCDALTNVAIPNNVTEMGDSVFYDCANLKSVTLSTSISSIGQEVFYQCSNLSSLVIPEKVTQIQAKAFYQCDSITELNLPKAVTAIGDYAFYGCDGIEEVVIPGAEIGAHAFEKCVNVRNVTLEEGTNNIKSNAFSETVIEQLTIPASVTVIEDYAFQNCLKLEKIVFFGDCPQLGARSFQQVKATCFYPKGNETYTQEIKNADFGGDLSWTYEGEQPEDDFNKCGETITWELTAEGTLRLAGEGAMYDYTDAAFAPWYENRTSISKIEISDGITHIGDYAFYLCNKVSSVILPNTLLSVGSSAFQSCSAQTIVTAEALSADAQITGLVLPEGVREVGESAFRNTSLKKIVLPDSLTYISDYMFCGAYELRTVDFQSTLKSIGISAFNNCYELESIVIPEGVTSIGEYAFYYCGPYTSYQWYYDCDNFKSVTLPSTLEYIGKGAFGGCQSLERIEIPEKIKVIEEGMFSYCHRLETVVLPAGLTDIGYMAFFQCKALKTITFQWNAPVIDAKTFSNDMSSTICYYAGNNPEWTSDLMQNYGAGKLTWVAQDMEVPGAGGDGGAGDGNGEEDGEQSGTGGGNGEGGENEGGSGSGEGDGNNGSGNDITINGAGTTAGAVIVGPQDGWKDGTNQFTVSCSLPCTAAISNDKGESYVRLEAKSVSEGVYEFTAENMNTDTILAVVVMGDVNGDGKITNADTIKLKATVLGRIKLDAISALAADVNKSSSITNADIIFVKAVTLGKTQFTW